MSVERREYEARPSGGKAQATRQVKLPGEAGHIARAETAKSIARRLRIAKREARMKELARGGN